MFRLRKVMIMVLVGVSMMTMATPAGMVVEARGVVMYQGSPYYHGHGYSGGLSRLGFSGNRAAYDDAYDLAFKYVFRGQKPRIPLGAGRDLSTRAGWEAGVEDATEAYRYGGMDAK